MHFNIALDLSHDGKRWRAANDEFDITGVELVDLDQSLKKLLIQHPIFGKMKDIEVVMIHDNSNIPEVVRQYSNHYFNRKVIITL